MASSSPRFTAKLTPRKRLNRGLAGVGLGHRLEFEHRWRDHLPSVRPRQASSSVVVAGGLGLEGHRRRHHDVLAGGEPRSAHLRPARRRRRRARG